MRTAADPANQPPRPGQPSSLFPAIPNDPIPDDADAILGMLRKLPKMVMVDKSLRWSEGKEFNKQIGNRMEQLRQKAASLGMAVFAPSGKPFEMRPMSDAQRKRWESSPAGQKFLAQQNSSKPAPNTPSASVPPPGYRPQTQYETTNANQFQIIKEDINRRLRDGKLNENEKKELAQELRRYEDGQRIRNQSTQASRPGSGTDFTGSAKPPTNEKPSAPSKPGMKETPQLPFPGSGRPPTKPDWRDVGPRMPDAGGRHLGPDGWNTPRPGYNSPTGGFRPGMGAPINMSSASSGPSAPPTYAHPSLNPNLSYWERIGMPAPQQPKEDRLTSQQFGALNLAAQSGNPDAKRELDERYQRGERYIMDSASAQELLKRGNQKREQEMAESKKRPQTRWEVEQEFLKNNEARQNALPTPGSSIPGKPRAVADGKGGFSYPSGPQQFPPAGTKIKGKPGAVADGKGGFSYPKGISPLDKLDSITQARDIHGNEIKTADMLTSGGVKLQQNQRAEKTKKDFGGLQFRNIGGKLQVVGRTPQPGATEAEPPSSMGQTQPPRPSTPKPAAKPAGMR